jgi:hypothetical protein
MPRIISAVDESRGRRVPDLELHAPGVAHDADVEVRMAVEDRARVVRLAAAVQHGERAAPVERIEPAAGMATSTRRMVRA